MPQVEQHFGGAVGRLHRVVSRLADRAARRDHPLRRVPSRWYGRALWALTAGRGVTAEINGEPFRIDPRFRTFLQPNYEAELAGFLGRRVRPGQVCLDVGAHIGAYALQFARWTGGSGRVIAFEPHPGTAAVLRRHVRLNGFERIIQVEQLALGSSAGTRDLYGSAASGLSRLDAPNPEDRDAPLAATVTTSTLDAYCGERGLRPDWVLVDVEGFEFAVLEGAAAVLAGGASVVVEVHPAIWSLSGWTRERGERLLASLGRRARPIGPMRDALGTYGAIELEPLPSDAGSDRVIKTVAVP